MFSTVAAAISRKKRKPVLGGKTAASPGHPGHQTWQCVISPCGVSSRTLFTPHHFQRHSQNCREHINTAIGTAHKTCLRGFGGNGSIDWTAAVWHGGRTSKAFKVTMKLQTFLFQMVVTPCIYVQYLWKYGFAKSSDNLYAPCTFRVFDRVLLKQLTMGPNYRKTCISINSNNGIASCYVIKSGRIVFCAYQSRKFPSNQKHRWQFKTYFLQRGLVSR